MRSSSAGVSGRDRVNDGGSCVASWVSTSTALFPLKGLWPVASFVEDDPEAEHVAAGIDVATARLFRAHVMDGAHHRADLGRHFGGELLEVATSLVVFREPEVDDLHVTARIQQDVRGLEVPMQDLVLVERGQG